MIHEIDKQIALEMAKSIINARAENTAANLEYRDKINEVSYWVDIYHQCLKEIASKSLGDIIKADLRLF